MRDARFTRPRWLMSPLARYAIALFATGTALLGEWLLWPLMEPAPFVLSYGAVFFAAWYGGLWPGVIATLLCATATDYLFLEPRGGISIARLRNALPLGLFIGLALLITRLSSSLRAAYQLAEQALIDAEVARAAEERARIAAEQASRAREEFLSIASHELRTPLTPIQLQIQSFVRQAQRSGAAGIPPDRVLNKLLTIERQIKRMTRLIEDLLDITRLTSGRLHLDPEDLDACAVLREVIQRSREEIARSGSTLHLRLDADTVFGRWDRLRLDQIITNLVSNAIKYGQGRPIEVSLAPEPQAMRLTVRDHGIGIAEEDQSRIFEQFERVVSVRHYGGFGLGLWIVRRIIDAMGGQIAVESHAGAGSTFTVVLPRTPPALTTGQTPISVLDNHE